MKHSFLFSILLVLGAQNIFAQDEDRRVVATGVPFLLISGDARASGLGDQGVATRVDAFSQQWNASKYAFSQDQQGIALAFTPYLRDIATDINIAQLNYFNRISESGAFAASLKYFSLGEVELRQTADQVPQIESPNEFALDLSYSLRLSDLFSMGVTGRFISSDLRISSIDGDASAANTFAADISMFYRSEEEVYKDFNGRWRAGLSISNIGPKISYTDDDIGENFLPTNFRAGVGFDFILDPSNVIGVYAEVNKLLVPTPPKAEYVEGSTQELTPESRAEFDDYNDTNEFSAIFSSWTDAPDGFSEELKEFTWALGAEYWYEDSFALRLGYFNESQEKGFRKFMTIGAGFKYSSITIDASYLFSTSPIQNPLEGTLRFGLTFNINSGAYYEY